MTDATYRAKMISFIKGYSNHQIWLDMTDEDWAEETTDDIDRIYNDICHHISTLQRRINDLEPKPHVVVRVWNVVEANRGWIAILTILYIFQFAWVIWF